MMARKRDFTQKHLQDEQLAMLPALLRIFWSGLAIYADRNGRLLDRPGWLRAHILPYEMVNGEDLLFQLSRAKLIQRYAVNDRRYIQILRWAEFYTPSCREKEACPPPPSARRQTDRTPAYPANDNFSAALAFARSAMEEEPV